MQQSILSAIDQGFEKAIAHQHQLDEDRARALYLGLTFLWTGSGARRETFGNGLNVRVEIYFAVSDLKKLRHMIGVSGGFESYAGQELVLDPDSTIVERTSIRTNHLWAQPGYEAWWLVADCFHLAFRTGFSLGTQQFVNGLERDWSITIGPNLALELRAGFRDKFGGRIGFEWAPEYSQSPVYSYRNFELDSRPPRKWHQVLRVYFGIYWGVASTT